MLECLPKKVREQAARHRAKALNAGLVKNSLVRYKHAITRATQRLQTLDTEHQV